METNIKKNRGQFFTTKNRVLDALVSLIKNEGEIFEPSAGNGHIVSHIEKLLNREVTCIELDENVIKEKICKSEIIHSNFFSYIKKSKYFKTVVGNPPFVKLKNIEKATLNLLPEKIPANGNLYYYFIKYCVNILENNGELIFIVPKEWLFNVSSQFVRDFLSKNGNFTHFIDCGEEKLFEDADVPALCIFRYQKNYSGKVKYYESLDDFYNNNFKEKSVIFSNTIRFSTTNKNTKKISDFFDVKVGIVSGAEKIFKINQDNEFPDNCLLDVISTDKNIYKYVFLDNFNTLEEIPTVVREYFELNKNKLINRKISNFDENNWWKYGALRNFLLMKSNRKRIYCLMKTRQSNLFWKGNENECFGGGILGLFLKDGLNVNLDIMVDFLNSNEFRKVMIENNMISNNKVTITPSVLSNLDFPFELI